MKRNEMVAKLSDVLLQFMPRVPDNQRRLIADVLLYETEREGMKPPGIKKEVFRDIESWPYSDTFYEWEPENESVRSENE